ncbi:ARM repeat-containing protein [Auriculariales sp. MPI-PUGE-AT-0066]|nr:ARM repeat-containing protein [Auriculariales sp. MPI-PUGE-AT-0066]
MDPASLARLFSTSYDANPNVRLSGELEIRKLSTQEGMLSNLIQVIAADGVDVSVRLAAAVFLKNRIRRAYFVPDDTTLDIAAIPESDRVAVKQHIFPLLVSAPSRAIRAPLAETLRCLISHDYPDKWPTLLDEIKALLGSTRIQEVIAGTIASLEITKAFRYRAGEDLVKIVVPHLLPQLANIALQLLAAPPAPLTPQSPEIPLLLHNILKIYRHTISQHLSAHQQSSDSIVPWGRLLFQVVSLRLPKEVVPEDLELREVCEWWKAKKWAYACLNRLFIRFGNPSQLPKAMQEYEPFAKHFIVQFAPEIFKVYLQQVELLISGQEWISRKCQCHILSYFTESVKPKTTWELVKPHFETLVSRFVFPHMCFTQQHRELWESDPVEYARMSIDEYEEYSSPVSGSTFFLLSLVKSRPKATFLPILNFVNSVLNGQSSPEQKYGALKITSALVAHMVRSPSVKSSIEPFLTMHVLPAYSAPEGYMRLIAMDVLTSIEKHEYEWSADAALEPHFRAVVAALEGNDLPTRVQAAIALAEMVNLHESVRQAVGGNIGKIVQDLLKLSDETDMDVLNSCMEAMVEHFDKELMPVATQLTQRLVATYMRPAETEFGMTLDDVGSEDKTFASMGTAKTIRTIIMSLENQKEILLQVQEIVVPMVIFTLSRQSGQALELYENMFDIVDALTFHLRIITPSLWPVFELTYQRFKTNARDFIDEMLPSLENFMTWGQDVFVARPDYRAMILDIYTSVMPDEHLGAADRCVASKLIEALLLNYRGHIDDLLPTIIATAVAGIKTPDQVRSARVANLQTLINTVLYNAPVAIELIARSGPGVARQFFDAWFTQVQAAEGLPTVHMRKLSILALSELLKVPPTGVPDELRDGWTGIVVGVLHVLKGLPEALAKRKALEEAFQRGDDDSDDDEEELSEVVEEEDEEGDVWDEDSKYIDFLAEEAARMRKARGTNADEESDGDSVDSDPIDEELGYLSPLEPVNPYQAFKSALTVLQTQNPAVYQASTTSLNQEQQMFLIEVMQIADAPAAAPAA